jgi:hypothetical protein
MEASLLKLLRVYNDPFFSDGQQKDLISAIREGHVEDTVQKARVWHLNDDDVKDISEHLSHRIPIHYGEPMSSGYPSYSDERLKEICGYSTIEAIAILSRTPLLTYCFGGPVYNLDDPTKNDAIVHAWPINLESSKTAHYNLFVKDGFLDDKLYEKQSRRTLRCIYGAARTLGYSRLSLPFLGLGDDLRELSPPQKQCARRAFFRALAIEAAANPFVSTEVRGSYRDEEAAKVALTDIGFNDLCSSVKVVIKNLTDTSEGPTLVVNPSDSRSFVGNGGKNDSTLDGFIISGECLSWRTTGYFHNNFLSKLSALNNTNTSTSFVSVNASSLDEDEFDVSGDPSPPPPPPPRLARSISTMPCDSKETEVTAAWPSRRHP